MLITGGSRGIGAATARLFAERGYAVCVNFRSDIASAERVAAEIEERGGRAIAVQADVSEEGDVSRLFETVDRELGRLDCLVNNAGILRPQSRLVDLSAARINEILRVNVTSCFLCAAAAVRRMSTESGGRGGSIVNVSSIAARLGAPNEYTDYAASKGAVDSMTRGLALEVAGEGIRVNGVRPGIIDTGIHADGGEPGRVARIAPNVPMKRGGRPEEVADVIYWLASDAASYATGTIVDVAGGR